MRTPCLVCGWWPSGRALPPSSCKGANPIMGPILLTSPKPDHCRGRASTYEFRGDADIQPLAKDNTSPKRGHGTARRPRQECPACVQGRAQDRLPPG